MKRSGRSLALVDDMHARAEEVRSVRELMPKLPGSFDDLAPGPQHRPAVPVGCLVQKVAGKDVTHQSESGWLAQPWWVALEVT